MGLIGLPVNGLAFAPLVLGAPTYSDLVASTLDGTGTFGADIDQSSSALSDLITAFENDVAADIQAEQLPKGSIFGPTIAVLTAIGVEIDVADATSFAIGSAFDFLAATFGVWSVFDQLLQDLNNFIANIVQSVYNIIASGLGGGVNGIGNDNPPGSFFGP